MLFMTRSARTVLVSVLVVLGAPGLAGAQLTKAGVVTTLIGTATVARATLRAPLALKFKDDVFVQDRITTGDDSVARILMGGKAIVTVRERSVLTITELPGTSRIDLGIGKVALAVVKERMKSGETIEIRTPNAVAGIRGTVVITEVEQKTAQLGTPSGAFTSRFTVLRGTVAVSQFNPLTGQLGPSVNLGPLQTTNITGATPPRPPQTITPEAAKQLASEYKTTIKEAPPAVNAPVANSQIQQAVSHVGAVLGPKEGPRAPEGERTETAHAQSDTGPVSGGASGADAASGAGPSSARGPSAETSTSSGSSPSAPAESPSSSGGRVSAGSSTPGTDSSQGVGGDRAQPGILGVSGGRSGGDGDDDRGERRRSGGERAGVRSDRERDRDDDRGERRRSGGEREPRRGGERAGGTSGAIPRTTVVTTPADATPQTTVTTTPSPTYTTPSPTISAPGPPVTATPTVTTPKPAAPTPPVTTLAAPKPSLAPAPTPVVASPPPTLKPSTPTVVTPTPSQLAPVVRPAIPVPTEIVKSRSEKRLTGDDVRRGRRSDDQRRKKRDD